MAGHREKEIERLMEAAERIGQAAELAEWLRAHPDSPSLPWILTESASGRARVCYPPEPVPDGRGRPKKTP